MQGQLPTLSALLQAFDRNRHGVETLGHGLCSSLQVTVMAAGCSIAADLHNLQVTFMAAGCSFAARVLQYQWRLHESYVCTFPYITPHSGHALLDAVMPMQLHCIYGVSCN